LLGFLFACLAISARADSLEDAVRALARKAASSADGISVTFELHNNSSLDDAPLASVSSAFQEELRRDGINIQTTKTGASIVLTLSQNLTEYLGVVQVHRGDSSETIMQPLGLVKGSFTTEPSFARTLHKQLLFSQDFPILDVVLSSDARQADVLGLQEIFHYHLQGDQWVLAGTERLPVHQPAGRDLQGLLFEDTDAWAAYLSGELCRLSFVEAKGWSCEKYGGPVPVRTVSPDIIGKKNVGFWLSAAEFDTETNPKLVVIGQDGVARLFEDGPEPVSSFPGWGSEIASLRTGCGTGWQLLMTGKGDWNEPDKIQAVEIQDRRMNVVSPPIEFPGAVIGLHTPKTAADAGSNGSAIAMIHNLQTGMYEAYRLTLACDN
jgi:hypothetical protein